MTTRTRARGSKTSTGVQAATTARVPPNVSEVYGAVRRRRRVEVAQTRVDDVPWTTSMTRWNAKRPTRYRQIPARNESTIGERWGGMTVILEKSMLTRFSMGGTLTEHTDTIQHGGNTDPDQ